MAVIGARPATGIPWFGGRTRSRVRPRPAPRVALRGAARRGREMTSIRGFLAVIVAAAGLGLFYLSQSTHVAATGYLIEDLDARLGAVRAEQERLTWEIARAQSPAVIERRALEELRLVPLDHDVIRFAPASTETTR